MREGEPSQTARRVAAQRRHFERPRIETGDPEADQRLHDDVAGDLPYLDNPLTAYLVSRTRFFDGAVVDALARGCRQVVVVGAGYDGRSLRYSGPGFRWFELDHPATLADKSVRLLRLGIANAATSPVGVDFDSDDVGQALEMAGHRAHLPSLFMCEGVTPYLDGEVIVGLLTSLRARAAASSELAIDFALTPTAAEAVRAREALQAAVTSLGEPFRSEVPAAQLAGLLGEAGWQVRRAVDPAGVEMASSAQASVFVTAAPLPDLHLRPMTSVEFDAVSPRLIADYAAEQVGAGNWSADEAQARATEQFGGLWPNGLDTPGMLLFVAADAAGNAIGRLWLEIAQQPGSSPRGYIWDIDVDEAQRGKGYGRALLRAAEQESVRHGADGLGLNVFCVNLVARRLYESAGYQEVTIQMRKPLPAS